MRKSCSARVARATRRARIPSLSARSFSGSSNYIGAKYCHFEEYYLVEEANAAGCYPNRTVCDYDDDIIFYGFGSGHPSEGQCCNDDPGDETY